MNTKLKILQGAGQIGGNIVLLEGENSRIILDFGIPLTELGGAPEQRAKDFCEKNECSLKQNPQSRLMRGASGNPTNLKLNDKRIKKYLPDIPDLYKCKQDKQTLIFISHAHPDHFGLLRYVDKSIPIYTTKETKLLIEKGSKLLYDNLFDDLNLIEIKETIKTPDFLIDAFEVNHSVAGACAFRITDIKSKKSILYSGDLRTHGRSMTENELFRELNIAPDYMILEGTTLSREETHTDEVQTPLTKTEQDLENEMTEIFSQDKMSLVCCSPLNTDRIMSVYNACRRANKTFVIDPYTAYILESFRGSNLPNYKSENIKVYCVPNTQSEKIFEDVKNKKFGHNKIAFDDIMAEPSKYVVKDNFKIAESITKRIDIDKINLVYSYWEGYLEDKNYRWHKYINQLKHVHTSGHIAKSDLVKLVDDLKPDKIIPIHTLANEKFKEYFGDKVILLDKTSALEII